MRSAFSTQSATTSFYLLAKKLQLEQTECFQGFGNHIPITKDSFPSGCDQLEIIFCEPLVSVIPYAVYQLQQTLLCIYTVFSKRSGKRFYTWSMQYNTSTVLLQINRALCHGARMLSDNCKI